MAIYSFKIPGLHKVSAQTAGEVCTALERSEAGLSPATLVEASRPIDAPLHGEFEWDDAVAAEQYRQSQAKGIIRNITVTVKDSTGDKPRAFVNIKGSGANGNYFSFNRVLENAEWKKQMLEAAKLDMRSFIAKYQSLQELSGVIQAMRAVS